MQPSFPWITPTDTADTFVGSGALDFPWWNIEDHFTALDVDVDDNWHIDLVAGALPGAAVRVNHVACLAAVQALAWAVDGVDDRLRQQCLQFLADPTYADIDACIADCVLQQAVIGEVVYG